jgi:SAM-dependent methyltransferase
MERPMPPTTVPTNLERFSGLGECYHAHRPTPPTVILDFLSRMAAVDRPQRVVDLGCGTGLSTRIWTGRAREVIGIEPNADMRAQAEAETNAEPSIRYQDGLSSATGLPDGCAEVVTCSQSLHWMEPESTFAEVARILRPGGVFAALDCDWPPAIHWEADAAFDAALSRARRLERELDAQENTQRWGKEQHRARMEASGRFRYVSEACFHSVESGDAERLVGLAVSQGTVTALLRMGYSEEELGLTALRDTATRAFGGQPVPWYFTYRVRYAIR